MRPGGLPSRTDMISKFANSSLGDRNGCVSDMPFNCLISISGSLRVRDAAYAASIGRPLVSTSVGYMRPSERFALCEIARSSLPALRWPSIQFQRSTGWKESSALNGCGGTLRHSLKKMLRWRFMLFGIDVHSYEQNAVNFPGSFAWSASSTLRFQTVPAISGDMSVLTGGPETRTLIAYSATRSISSFVRAFRNSGAAAGILLTAEPGSFAI